MIVGSYSLKNLIQNEKFLLDLTQELTNEIDELERAKEEVQEEQKEAHKQGLLVKKMTNYMSDELGRLELQNTASNSEISDNLKKLSDTENKLRHLRGRLSDFVEGDDVDSLESTNSSLSEELKKYEVFLLDLTNLLNEKISNLEKITIRFRAEKKESQQQKILLREMIELFNNEIEDLENTFEQLKH